VEVSRNVSNDSCVQATGTSSLRSADGLSALIVSADSSLGLSDRQSPQGPAAVYRET